MNKLLVAALAATSMLVQAMPAAAQSGEGEGRRGGWSGQRGGGAGAQRGAEGGNAGGGWAGSRSDGGQRSWSRGEPGAGSSAPREGGDGGPRRWTQSGNDNGNGWRGQQQAPSAVTNTPVPPSSVPRAAPVTPPVLAQNRTDGGREQRGYTPRNSQSPYGAQGTVPAQRNWSDQGNGRGWNSESRTGNNGERDRNWNGNRDGNAGRDRDWNGNRDGNAGRDRDWNGNRGNDWRGNDGRGNNDWRDNRNWSRDRNDGYRNGYQGRLNDRQRWSDQRRWSNDWRRDNRYDWQRYRTYNRNIYRLPRYYAPSGWGYGYSRFSIGIFLNSLLFSPTYWIDDPYYYRLPPAYGPLRWIRYYDDALLVDIRDGYVVDVVYNFFW